MSGQKIINGLHAALAHAETSEPQDFWPDTLEDKAGTNPESLNANPDLSPLTLLGWDTPAGNDAERP